MMPRQPDNGRTAVTASPLFTGDRPRKAALPRHPGYEWFRLIGNPVNLSPVTGGGDQECRQSPINTHPAALLAAVTNRMPVRGMQVSGLGNEADHPTTRPIRQRHRHDLRPACGDHPPQPARVLLHPHRADHRQSHRPRAVLADSDHGPPTGRVLVPQPKRWDRRRFQFELRKPHPGSGTLSGPRIPPRHQPSSEVHGSFLEHLLAHLISPPEPDRNQRCRPRRIDRKHPSGLLGLLPRIEPVDVIEPGPRHPHILVTATTPQRRLRHSKTLIECEPCRTGMADQQ